MSAVLLAAVCLGVAVLVAVVSYATPVWAGFRPRPGIRLSVFPVIALAAAVILIFFLLTLPQSPPWSPGQRLGFGLLIGGAFGLMALLGCARLVGEERTDEPAGGVFWPYPSVFSLSLATAAVSLNLLLFRSYPADALLGGALGFGAVAGIARVLPIAAAEVPAAMEAAALLAVTAAAGTLLARQHFVKPGAQGWWPYVLALCALWLLGYAISHSFSVRSRPGSGASEVRAGILAGIPGAVLVLLVGWLLASRLEAGALIIGLLLLGLVTGGLVVWLSLSGEGESVRPEFRARSAALASVLVLFLVVVAFKVLQGFGVAVALAAAWARVPVVLGLRADRNPQALSLLALGANYLLLRVALEALPGHSGELDTSLQYTLIGIVLGTLLPVLLSSLSARPGAGRALLLGLLAVASPIIVLALWGADAGLGLLVGLVAAPVVVALLAPFAPAAWVAPATLISVGLALITVQLGSSATALYELPRLYKALLAGGVALVTVLWILGVGLRSRTAQAPAPAQEG